MKKLLIILFLLLSVKFLHSQPTVKFAVIGDYGFAGPNELAVANLVKSWNPDFIITLGDNNYDLGDFNTIDSNIGQYYHEFIYPYTGNFGQGDSVNRFWPSLGNHDFFAWPSALPYLWYFDLPNNERYYDFIKGNVHFFVVNSGHGNEPDPWNVEPDGKDSNSIQAQWIKNKLAQSTEKWNIIYFHHPPYSSLVDVHALKWPFKQWGVTTVLTSHAHFYERLNIDGFTYFVNGLGGRSITVVGTTRPGSQLKYHGNYGAQLIYAYNDSLVLKFINVNGDTIDSYKILPAVKSLTLNVLIEGFYNSNTNTMVNDTARVYLRNVISPYIIVDSAKGYLNFSGTGTFNFSNAKNATDYYLIVKHRNSIEAWSATGKRFTANLLNYDFTSSPSQAYGNNLVLKGMKYCIYSGDVNQDGIIDASDLSLVDNAVYNPTSGYIATDINGDNFVDASDLSIADNNVYNSITISRP